MSFARLKRFSRTTTFRLTLYYAATFTGSFIMAMMLIDRTVFVLLRSSDRDYLRDEFRELKEETLADPESLVREFGGRHSSVAALRIADAQNNTLQYFSPEPVCRDMAPRFSTLPLTPGLTWSEISIDHRSSLDVATLHLRNGTYLQVARSDRRRRQVMRHFERASAAVMLPVIIVATAGGAFLASRTLQPVRELQAAVRKIIATSRTDARLASSGSAGELQDLIAAFNEMLERIQSLIETLKGTLDNVAHDLRTPVSRLRGIAELALRSDNSSEEELKEALADCVEESERVTTLLNTLMDIAEVESGAMKLALKPVDLSQIAEEIVELYEHVAEERSVKLEASGDGRLIVMADENRLRQAVANLVDNAVKYTPRNGVVSVTTAMEQGKATLAVSDSGTGIAPEEHERIWQRLYRTDHSRTERGLGLGLSLVRAVMQAHHGRAELTSVPGEGACFTLRFPLGSTDPIPAGPEVVAEPTVAS